MRFMLHAENRLGITQEILAVIVQKGLDIRGVEVTVNYIYFDIPGLREAALPALSEAILKQVPGVHEIAPIELLPTERRRAQLHTVLSTLPDPVIAVDRAGLVQQTNEAAQKLTKKSEAMLRGQPLDSLLLRPLFERLRAGTFRLPETEVSLSGENFMLHAEPIRVQDAPRAKPAGAVLIFQRPDRLGRTVSALTSRESETGFDAIIGETAVMRGLKDKAARLAKVDAPLLILGETGTGKELFARACHGASRRDQAPFLALNCAALPENLAESELFGYASGAFTDAAKGGKPGLLELAHGGTVFLDEIGELSPYLQAKLLRFLQDGTFRRVGGTRERKVDVRVISATNRDLEAMVRDGGFREDLFYRLNVLSITLPPLRERREDIPALARHFTERAARQIGCPPPELTPELLQALAAQPWPGNIRQLENELFRAVSLSEGGKLTSTDLTAAADTDAPGGATPNPTAGTHGISEEVSYREALESFERALFARLYPQHPSSRKLAKALGLSHTTVADKLRKYGIG